MSNLTHSKSQGTYTNPLPISIPGTDQKVTYFADPSIIKGNDGFYYGYSTGEYLNPQDPNSNHLIKMIKSQDLVNWTYIGDVFQTMPPFYVDQYTFWAPAIHYIQGRYVLYYSVMYGADPPAFGTIGAATSDSPAGPWTVYEGYVVEGEVNVTTIDPAIVEDPRTNELYIYYGSLVVGGGIYVRKLSPDGLTSDPNTQFLVVTSMVEAAYVLYKDCYFYLFTSLNDCCPSATDSTAYTVIVSRAKDPYGPFIDKRELRMVNNMLDITEQGSEVSTVTDFIGIIGGTTVLAQNGNRWIGPGSNCLIKDEANNYYIFYHAVDRFNPSPNDSVMRQLCMDPLIWEDGWPYVVCGPSNTPKPSPVTSTPLSKGHTTLSKCNKGYIDRCTEECQLLRVCISKEIRDYSTYFDKKSSLANFVLAGPGPFPEATVTERELILPQITGEYFYVRDAPSSQDYVLETLMKFNYQPIFDSMRSTVSSAGLVIMQDETHYVKLGPYVNLISFQQLGVNFGINNGYPPTLTNGFNIISGGLPQDRFNLKLRLRIAKKTINNEKHFTAYVSYDGCHWLTGGAWVNNSIMNEKIGFISSFEERNNPPYNPVKLAKYKYLKVYSINS